MQCSRWKRNNYCIFVISFIVSSSSSFKSIFPCERRLDFCSQLQKVRYNRPLVIYLYLQGSSQLVNLGQKSMGIWCSLHSSEIFRSIACPCWHPPLSRMGRPFNKTTSRRFVVIRDSRSMETLEWPTLNIPSSTLDIFCWSCCNCCSSASNSDLLDKYFLIKKMPRKN